MRVHGNERFVEVDCFDDDGDDARFVACRFTACVAFHGTTGAVSGTVNWPL